MRSSSPRLSSLRLGVVVAAVASLANCNCGEVLGQIPVPEIGILNEASEVHKDADPWMVIDFGDADTGQTALKNLKVKNIGGGTLHISQVCLVNAPDEATAVRADVACLGAAASPFVFPVIIGTELKAGATVDLPVTFKPVAGGPASVFLRIGSDSEKEPLAAVQLTGRGTAGTLCADPGTLDFGDVVVGESRTLPVTISNCGVKPVTIDEASVTPNPDTAFVALKDGAALAGPIAPLDGEASFVVDVTFTPTQVGPYRDARSGAITLNTAAPFAALYVVPLLGNGIDRPACRVNVVPQTINYGGVAANTTQTRQLIVQSVGQCACQVTGFTGPTATAPTLDGLFTATAPSLPVVLKGTTGCDADPAGAAAAPSVLTVDIAYTAPDRQDPIVDRATVEVTTDAFVEPVRVVALEANGGGAPFCQLDITPHAPTGGFSSLGAQGRVGLVEFGRTSIHIAKRQPVVVTNIGNSRCNVTDIVYEKEANTLANEFSFEDDAGNNGVNGAAFFLEPGQAKTFFAIFAPTHTVQADPNNPLDLFSFGSYSGSLGDTAFSCGLFGDTNSRCNGVAFITDDVTTLQPPDDDATGRFSIGFSGTPVEPSVDVIPPELDFGLVTLDCGSPERRTTIYNTGSLDLVIGQPVVDPASTPVVFQVTATSNPGDSPNDATSGWPYTIQPGDSLSIAVRYFARQLGTQTALLVVPTLEDDNGNLVDGPPVTVPLLGEGTLEREQTDIFDQASEPTVDVLFVIDDSASMEDNVDQLADNFPQFFTASGVSNANFHLAVTTTLNVQEPCTDISGNCPDDDLSGYSSSCTGSDRILTSANANADDQFQCNARVYDPGNVKPSRTQSSVEGGLRAAYNFLSPPNITDAAINGGFMRDEAKLHVIIVSDEVDSSRGPTDLYIDFFQNLKGFRNSSLVAVSAIAKEAGETCGGNDGDTGNGRYKEVVDAMNGRFQSICAQDWSGTMSSLGLDSLGLQVEFFLTRAATESTLSVCVRNGSTTAACTPQTQVQAAGPTGYFYDDTNNSIVFNSGSVPPRGSRIEVNYETFCFGP